ncbi:DNA methyltransferase, partial [Vibrio parahaemolyticus]
PNMYDKIHPTQKPIGLLKKLIEIFTDEGDVVIDPCAGSGSTLVAATELNRKAFGFEIDRKIYANANQFVMKMKQRKHD